MINYPFPWQKSTWEILHRSYHQQRFPHALLITGQTGVGKVHFARCLAQLLLCQKPHETYACGRCRGCHLLTRANHPDFFEVTLLEESKIIKIDQIRKLREQLYQTTHIEGYQVILMFPANQLNSASANALLKTLEEPIGKAIFILVADQLGAIPATVLSRCQKIKIQAQASPQVMTWLKDNMSVNQNPENAELFLSLADHAPLRAKQLSELNYLALRNQILEYLLKMLQFQNNSLVLAESLAKNNIALLLYAFTTLIMDIMCLQFQVSESLLHNRDCVNQLQILAEKMSATHLAELLNYLAEFNQFQATQANINWQLAIEKLLLQCSMVKKYVN